MDPDSDLDPAIFIIGLKDAYKKVPLYNFFKETKSQKEVAKIKVFLTIFCLLIEGSGSIPLTNGSGSGSRRPKNM